ncbi:MAG TPA: hypothetical protein VK206_17045, partial [Anaerolineales bacterium]|nr:hypothetical protein [Anaerolineales bacterium]
MKSDVHPLRVLLKAIFLFIAINIIFAFVNPPLGKITLYNHLVPGRVRFPYEQKASFYFVGYNAPVYEDFDAMFGAHLISTRKPGGEFRLILLGDSTTWGFGLRANEMLSEQINRLHLQTCDGRTIRAYNLGYPYSSVARDLLVLDKAMHYQPDMVLWIVTLSTLEPKTEEMTFIAPHAERYLQLARTYGLKTSDYSQPIKEPSFWDKTIVGQRKRLKNIALTQALGLLWAATGIDEHESLQPEPGSPSPDVGDSLNYLGESPSQLAGLFDSLRMDVLSAAYKVAGDVPIVLVNEPIFVAGGKNHLIRYNGFYPRWVFDQYRQFMLAWTEEQGRQWLDDWNVIPP